MPDNKAKRPTNPQDCSDEFDRLIYVVSHDLRSPLTSILGMTQIIREDYLDALGDEGNYYLDRIHSNALKMESLINDLMKLSLVGKLDLVKENVDVLSVIQGILSKRDKCGKVVEFKIDDHLPKLFIVRSEILEVLENLIDNAISFMGEQERPLVKIAYERTSGEHVFSICDNGIGISAENANKIFKVFERVRDIDTKGNGIGLALSKKIIENYGGSIWVESKIGEGSVFYFTIPLEEAEIIEI